MTESKPSSGISNMFNSVADKINHSIQQVPNPSAIQHSLRQQAVIHNPHQLPETLSIQLLNKSIISQISDINSLARESKLVSKTLTEWGKVENEGLHDLSKNIAALISLQSEVEEDCAKKSEAGRAELKLIRNLGNELVAYRQKKELSLKQGNSSKVVFTPRDHELEKMNTSTFDIYKREKLQQGFQLQFVAQRELGEKLAIIARFGELLCEDDSFNHQGESGAKIVARARSEVQTWTLEGSKIKNGSISTANDSSSTQTKTQSEIDAKNYETLISAEVPNAPPPTPTAQSIPAPPRRSSLNTVSISPTPGVTSLNFSPPPTPFRQSQSTSSGTQFSSPESHTLPLPTEPGLPPLTVAETGVPIISGSGGPRKGDLATSARPEIPETPVSLASLGGGVPVKRNDQSVVGRDDLASGTVNTTGNGGTERGSSRVQDGLPQYEDAVMASGDEFRARYEAESILAREREMKEGRI